MQLSRDELLSAYQTMKTIRVFEDRVNQEMGSGDIPGAVHLYAGQEASAVGICSLLDSRDQIASTHRGHGHCIAKGCDVPGMMAEIFGKQNGVFLGDSGSNLVGFWVAWIAIYASQSQIYSIEPITILWFVAIPLLDCIGLIFTRTINGISWTTAGRDHIHHKLQDYGFSNELVYSVLILSAGSLSALGIFLNKIFQESNYYSFYAFLILWICFHIIVNKIPKNV